MSGEIELNGEPAFPANWPPGCPPEEAPYASALVFRLVTKLPLSPEDFRSVQELGKGNPERACDSVGLSVFLNSKDAFHYRDKYPYLGEYVAQGALAEKHGKLQRTPRRGNSHATWWPFEGIARHELFELGPDL